MGGSFAVLVATLAAAPVNYELSLRTEARTGTAYLAATSMASFLELAPVAGLSTRFDRTAIEASYRPSLLYSLNVDHTLTVLHRGNLGASWQPSRKTRVNFDQSLAYGRNDFSPLYAIQGTTPPDPHLPRVLILAYFSSTSSVGVNHSTLRGLEVGGSASYSLSGGLDQLARSVLPLSRTGTVNGHADFELTRTDWFTSNANASVSRFSNGANTEVANIRMGWRRQVTRATQGDVSFGVSMTRSARPGFADAVGAGPSATLGISHQAPIKRPHQLSGSARVSYSAAIDPYGGGAYQRIEGVLGADYSAMGWISFGVRGTGARGLSPPELRNALWQLEFTSRATLDRHLAVGGGFRTAWISNSGAFPLQPVFQWAAFVGVIIQQQGRL